MDMVWIPSWIFQLTDGLERCEGNAVGSQSQTKTLMPSISPTLVMVHHGNVVVNGSMSNVTFKFEGDRRVVIDQYVSFIDFIKL